jgi:hypothetical protein
MEMRWSNRLGVSDLGICCKSEMQTFQMVALNATLSDDAQTKPKVAAKQV